MNKDEFYALVGHQDVHRDIDVKLIVMDYVREHMSQEEIDDIFWRALPAFTLDEIKGYFYRKRGGI